MLAKLEALNRQLWESLQFRAEIYRLRELLAEIISTGTSFEKGQMVVSMQHVLFPLLDSQMEKDGAMQTIQDTCWRDFKQGTLFLKDIVVTNLLTTLDVNTVDLAKCSFTKQVYDEFPPILVSSPL